MRSPVECPADDGAGGITRRPSCLRIHNAGPVDLDVIEIEETSEHPDAT